MTAVASRGRPLGDGVAPGLAGTRIGLPRQDSNLERGGDRCLLRPGYKRWKSAASWSLRTPASAGQWSP
jgi:hypothetical protein